jgi:hypothetical protein
VPANWNNPEKMWSGLSEKIMPNNEARTATRLRRLLQRASGGCGVAHCGRRPIQKIQIKKPAAGFPARALKFLR